MGSPTRAFVRIFLYLGLTLFMVPLQVLALACSRHLSSEIPIFYHRMCCRILGLRVVAHGTISSAKPTLFVSNHVSYIDISVLASLIRGSFIAKAEVAQWPFFGTLARLQRTVFIARRGPDAARHRDEMKDRLGAGDSLILFPEGTSDDGIRVLPFKSALFSVAETDVNGGSLPVQPVSISYTRLDGMPLGRGFKSYYAWYGDMGLLSHFWGWLGLGTATVDVVFHPPRAISQVGSRKALAQECYETVAASVAGANSGRAGDGLIPLARRA